MSGARQALLRVAPGGVLGILGGGQLGQIGRAHV